jgi:hypothetical protein
MTKSIEDQFTDWEGSTFGYGYGTGEDHTILALKAFMAAIPERGYDYRVLETTLTPSVTWLLINILCRANILEYGTSPRFGWLTPQGERLKAFIDPRSVEYLCALTQKTEDYVPCYPDTCNCDGTSRAKCANIFWR